MYLQSSPNAFNILVEVAIGEITCSEWFKIIKNGGFRVESRHSDGKKIADLEALV